MSGEYEVIHRPELRKFLIRLAPGTFAFLGYELRGNKMYITKTYTPPEFRGRGIATYLTNYAVNWARENGYKIVPVCSFAVSFFRKNRELQELLDEEGLRALQG